MSANVMGGELWVETMNFGSINNLHSKGATYYVVAKKRIFHLVTHPRLSLEAGSRESGFGPGANEPLVRKLGCEICLQHFTTSPSHR